MDNRVPEEIKNKLSLEQLIEKMGVKLVRQNARYAYALCPFHDDHTPSFTIDKTWQNAKCFSSSCRDIGTLNHISFIQQYEHLPREMAIDYLYKMAGEERPIDSDHDVMRRVAEMLHGNIHMDKPAAFFKERGIMDKTLFKLSVGYSPSFQWLKEAITNIPADQAASLELLRPEMFNDTITYPQFDALGRVCGFRNRSFGSGLKYIGNTGNFKLKPSKIYGLHLIGKGQRQVVLVEGANDVLGLHSAGMMNAAGLNGTNLDGVDKYLEEHGFTDIVFMADGDSPGWLAALKAPHMIRVTQVPAGKDPDEFVRDQGLVPAVELVEKAKYPIEIKLDSRLEKIPSNMTQKIMLIKQIVKELSDGLPSILLAVIQQKIAEAVGITVEQVEMVFSLVELDTDQLEQKIVYHLSTNGTLSEDIKMTVVPKMFNNFRMRQCMEQLYGGLSLTESVSKAEGLTPGDVSKFVDMDRRRQTKKALLRVVNSTTNLSEPIDDLVSKAISKLVDSSTEQVEVMEATDLINIGLININERINNPGHIPISFGRGFSNTDKILQGVRPNAMYVLAATQGTGKSALAFEWALDMACRQNVPVLWVSLEMSRGEMADRALAKLTGISAAKIATGNLDDQELANLREEALKYSRSPLYYVDTGMMNINQIVALTRKLKITKSIKVVFIDYLQLIEGGSRDQNMYERVGYISRMIKSGICMDKSIGIPVIAVAQLSKMAAKSDAPTAEHIAESYKIAQDADCFLTIKRRDKTEVAEDQLNNVNYGNLLLHIDKNRNGQSKIKQGLTFDMNNLQIREVY